MEDDVDLFSNEEDFDESAFADLNPAILQKAGDVIYNEVLLVTNGGIIDIRDFVVEINIYEDMFSPCLHGNVIIRDTQNLIEKVPLIGDEILTLDISTPQLAQAPYDPTNKIQKSFAVYAIKNRFLSNEDKEQLYSMHFISMEGMVDNVSYLCQKYEGTTDEIAAKVFEDSFKDIPRYLNDKNTKATAPKSDFTIGDTPHTSKVSFLPPMWTPFQIMGYLSKRALGTNVTDAPTFLFYETTKGFYMCSINDLIRSQMEVGFIVSKLKYRKKYEDEQLGENAIRLAYSHVENLEFLTNMDILKGQDLGHFASSLFTLDVVKKEYVPTSYDHGFEFQKYPHLGSYKSAPDQKGLVKDDSKKYNSIFPATVIRSSDSKVFIETTHPGVLDSSDPELMNLHPEKYVQQRNSLFSDISTMKMKITIPGRTDMEVGTIVDFDYPSVGSSRNQATPEESVRDQWISGYYMITAIHHQITKLRHNMICEISKDSYLQDLVVEEAAPATPETAAPKTNPPSTTTTPAPKPAPTS
jgi:hypothetical protein